MGNTIRMENGILTITCPGCGEEFNWRLPEQVTFMLQCPFCGEYIPGSQEDVLQDAPPEDGPS